MGSVVEPGEMAAKASNQEWIEIKNISDAAIDLDGWQILDSAGNIKISFGAGDTVCIGFPARGFAPERAVSLSGKPKSGVSFSTELVYGGQAGPSGSRQC